MEPWRRLLNEGAFHEARDAVDEAVRVARAQMAEGRRQLEQNFEKAERDFAAEIDKVRLEIDEAEQKHRDRPGEGVRSVDPDQAEPWRDLIKTGAFDGARRAVNEAERKSRTRRERGLRRFEEGADKARRSFGKAEQDFRAAREQVDVNLEETRREFERMGLEADRRFEKARAEIALAEQAQRDDAAGRS